MGGNEGREGRKTGREGGNEGGRREQRALRRGQGREQKGRREGVRSLSVNKIIEEVFMSRCADLEWTVGYDEPQINYDAS